MKLALLQANIVWNNPQANFGEARGLLGFGGAGGGAPGRERPLGRKPFVEGEEGIARVVEAARGGGDSNSPGRGTGDLSGVDLIVLPEMFTTGYALDPVGIAHPDGGAEVVEWMRRLAAETDAAVTGSVAVEVPPQGGETAGAGGRFYNRMFFVKPDGGVTHYDKRHLFSFAGEEKFYTPGHERVVVEWRGWRILLQICYDLRFGVFSRNRGDYDMIVYVANWPTVRLDAWRTLVKARAIENLCWVAAVNRVGSDPSASYSGGTCVVDYKGRVSAEAAANTVETVVAEANLDAIADFRGKFPALKDADNFKLEL